MTSNDFENCKPFDPSAAQRADRRSRRDDKESDGLHYHRGRWERGNTLTTLPLKESRGTCIFLVPTLLRGNAY